MALFLVEASADVNKVISVTAGAGTPIFAALIAKNYGAARLHLKHGAQLKARDGRFDNILQIASMIKNRKMVAASLQDSVVPVDVRDGLYETPLPAACAVGADDCAKIFVGKRGRCAHLGRQVRDGAASGGGL
jgi:hypothetical protein